MTFYDHSRSGSMSFENVISAVVLPGVFLISTDDLPFIALGGLIYS